MIVKEHNMIKKLYVLATIAVVLTAVSCSDQDFDDPNGPSAESVTIQTLVTGIEGGLRINQEVYIRVVSVFAREAYFFEPSDPRYTTELLRGPIDTNGFLLTRPWESRYQVIRSCNQLIETSPQLANQSDRLGATGFAKTMMAYQLLLVLNYTDTNGIRIDVATEPVGPIVDKTTAMNRILSLLDDGLGDLQAAGNSFSFNLSSGFSAFNTPATFAEFNRALKARAATYAGDYQAALSALEGSFLNAAGSMNDGAYNNFSTNSGDRTNPIFETPTAEFVKFMAHPSFANDAEAGDSRVSEKTFLRDTPTTFDQLTADRAMALVDSSTSDWPILRNEELLLLRAEARIHTDDLAGAQADINLVRQVAGLGEVTLDNEQQAIDQLLHERRYSLFGEGHRWIDLRRYGRLGSLPIDRSGDVVIERMPLPSEEL